MATTHKLTGRLTDAVGGALLTQVPTGLRGVVEISSNPYTNTTDGETRMGTVPITFATDGSWSVTGLPATGTGQGWVPVVQAMRIRVSYVDPGTGEPFSYVSPWFQLTADTAFKDVVQTTVAAIDDVFTARTQAQSAATAAAGSASAAGTSAAAAAASAQQAHDISGLVSSDAVMTAVANDPNSAFRAAQSASFEPRRTVAGTVTA